LDLSSFANEGTFEDSVTRSVSVVPSGAANSLNLGMIVGMAVAGFVVLVVIIGGIAYLSRHHSYKYKTYSGESECVGEPPVTDGDFCSMAIFQGHVFENPLNTITDLWEDSFLDEASSVQSQLT
jgi:hypothetical protein